SRMSSPGYAAVSLDLPRVTLAEAAAAALCLLCAVTIEAVLGRYPAAPSGVGVLVGGLAALWLYLDSVRPARSLRRVVWLPDDTWRLGFRDGSVVAAGLAAGDGMFARWLV